MERSRDRGTDRIGNQGSGSNKDVRSSQMNNQEKTGCRITEDLIKRICV